MNYRHAFHAGNFADVFKHVVIGRILVHLREKVTPFRVIDTHAGDGLYDLAGEEANRTGEWRDGVGRLAGAALPMDVLALIAPYLAALRACNEGIGLRDRPCWSVPCCGRRIASSPASSSRTPRWRCPATCAARRR